MDESVVTCPCCNSQVDIDTETLLLDYEAQVWKIFIPSTFFKPWYMRSKDWIIPIVQQQKIQWACIMCLELHRALPGDLAQQTFSNYAPYFAYYDTTHQCSDCRQEFIFSAAEQQYWYEHLKFWVQSRPKQCLACRRQRRQHNAANNVYQQAFRALDNSQPDTHLQAARAALEAGYLPQSKTHLQRARRLTGTTYSIEELRSSLNIADPPQEAQPKPIS